ncbi:HSP20 family protein [Rhizobium mongolense subsp. loessense]|uniref:HSP20 family protein n=1 Tax=Rhizobium mongolense subsp. loessense TaxID=158890 RepID=A0A1G4RVK5_9HYPH|nr:Hsp20/alpha crystallin family protein [Rhizobium mongolense]SCW60870.1 HSP20 family protein [Rhizobium mongolense subsp. loessense]
MTVRDLIPWSLNNGSKVPSPIGDKEQNPFLSLHREMNRLFDDVFRSFDSRFSGFGSLASFNGGWPNVEVFETDEKIKVAAELPGLEIKDVEVLLDNGVLTLKGEKRSETEDGERQFSERYYGRFERRIPLGCEVEEDKVDATFRNGVLSVSLPKTEKVQSRVKRITINS